MHDGMFGPEGAGLSAVVVGEYTPIVYWGGQGTIACPQCAPHCIGEADVDGNPVDGDIVFAGVIPASRLDRNRCCEVCGLYGHNPDALYA